MTPALIEDLGLREYGNKGKRTRFGLYECPICKCHWEVRTADVKNGSSTKCNSCKISINNTTHGVAHTDEYKLLKDMKRRCYDKTHVAYSNYGGRGIGICSEWLDSPKIFIMWCWDNGYKKGLKIDRINNDGNYEPLNCRFITHQENCCNTRLTHKDNKSGYRGVHLNNGKYYVEIQSNKVRTKLGSYSTALEAAIAYDSFVISNSLPHPTNLLNKEALCL